MDPRFALHAPDLFAGGLVLLALYWDQRWRRVPNAISLGGLLVALAVRGLQGELALALAGAAFAFAVGFALWRLGGAMRAGDAKLLMALGAVYGPLEIARTYLLLFALSIPVGLLLLLRHGRLRSFFRVVGAGLRRGLGGGGEPLPETQPLRLPYVWVIASSLLLARAFPSLMKFWT